MTPPVLSRLSDALGPVCRVAWRPTSEGGTLMGAEAETMRRAIPARRDEFSAGRAAARVALAGLGLAACPIPMRADRAPHWPAGVVGSISHGAGIAAAVVARTRDVLALGLDIEPQAPLPPDTTGTVLRPGDPGQTDPMVARAVFCAKEATYKALYPLTGEIWEFGDLGIRLPADTGTFEAILHRPAGPFAAGDVLTGRLLSGDGLWVAALCLPRP